jgi:hypothetical protein
VVKPNLTHASPPPFGYGGRPRLQMRLPGELPSTSSRLSTRVRFPTPRFIAVALIGPWTSPISTQMYAADVRFVACQRESSGGGLAAGLAIIARDAGGPSLALQVLEVPSVDLSLTQLEPIPHEISAIEVARLVEAIEFYLPEGKTLIQSLVSSRIEL